MVSAAILASGTSGSDFEKTFGVTHKCLIEIGGQPMIRRVLDAARDAPSIDRVVVVGPERELHAAGVTEEIVPNTGDDYARSLHDGVAALKSDRILLLAADVPFLSGTDLEAFVQSALATQAEACFPIVTWEAMQARLPGVRKTWYDLRDGTFTKGNAALGYRDFFRSREDRLHRLFQARKKKQWFCLMRPAFMERILRKSATLADVESGLSWYLGAPVRAVHAAPELAADIDEVSDVAYARALWRERDAAQS